MPMIRINQLEEVPKLFDESMEDYVTRCMKKIEQLLVRRDAKGDLQLKSAYLEIEAFRT